MLSIALCHAPSALVILERSVSVVKDLAQAPTARPDVYLFLKSYFCITKIRFITPTVRRSFTPCIALRSRMTGAGSVRRNAIDNKSAGYRKPPCGGRWLASARRKESACMKSYKPYTILDNHAYGIYSPHNLSFYLYYTHSPSPDFRRELPPQEPDERFRSFKLTAKP